MSDPDALNRFVDAQSDVYKIVLQELTAGKKQTHWMWFIFPQIDGLATSATAKYYGIKNMDEAQSYLQHKILGPRLLECTSILLKSGIHSAHDIFGYPDDMKFRSCMTLFSRVAGNTSVFSEAIAQYFDGDYDKKTLDIINQSIVR